MMNQKYQVFLEEWQPNFQTRSYSYKSKPIQQRVCRDPCCIPLLLILLLSFLGLGVYSFLSTPLNYHPSLLIMLVTISVSFLLSVLLTFLLGRFPQATIYTSIVTVFLILTAVAVVCFVFDGVAVGVIALLAVGVYLLLIGCCFQPYLPTAVLLAKITKRFLIDRPQVYASVLMAFLAMAMVLVWVVQLDLELEFNTISWMLLVSMLLMCFLIYFLYYSATFLVAVQAAHWYHRCQATNWIGFKWLVTRHLGSMTFACLTVTLVKIARMMSSNSQRHDNACKKVCTCLVRYCLCMLQGFLKTMNHYAIIMSALTGQGYIDSAKSAGVLIFSNIGLFSIVQMLECFFSYIHLIICAGLPTLLCVVVTPMFTNLNLFVVGVYTLIACMLISVSPLVAFTESMCSIFMYFCVNRKLMSYGVKIDNIPEELFDHYKRAFSYHEEGAVLSDQDYVHCRRVTSIIPPRSSVGMQQVSKSPRKSTIRTRTSIMPIFPQTQPTSQAQQTAIQLFHHPILYDRSTRHPITYRNVS